METIIDWLTYLALAFYFFAIYLPMACIYLYDSKHYKISFKYLALFSYAGLVTILLHNLIVANIMNRIYAPEDNPGCYILLILLLGFFISSLVGGVIGLRIYRWKTMIYFVVYVTLTIFLLPFFFI